MSRLLLRLALFLPVFLVSCADSRHLLRVSVAEQSMQVYEDGKLTDRYRVSTSKFGLGDDRGSNKTPLGRFIIAEKVGGGQPSGMKFVSRKPTGEIVKPNSPGRDPIVSRILWLRGLDPWNKNAYSRTIYIHGTAEEWRLGTPASFGCVRMASKDIIRLYDDVGRGARVEIFAQPFHAVPPVPQPKS